MTATLHKLIGTAMLGLALFSQSLPAWAGLAYAPEVFVGTTGASGSMAGARYSADSTQKISCSFENTNGPFVMCSASDKTGKTLSCTSTEARYVAAAKAITDFSYINFSVTSGGVCSYLGVDNYSMRLR
jgi:hypothetical protein